MCGIAGIWKNNKEVNLSELLDMSRAIIHRGPDDVGHVLINTKGKRRLLHFGKDKDGTAEDFRGYDLALAHRRLAIIDLTPSGHQPMTLEGCTLVYNGEIYNYLEIRSELKSSGHSFFSSSDTEVLLRAYLEWGIDCLSHLNGMFAFSIWDSRKSTLFCARDRMGIKPFYYYNGPDCFIFASEIRSVLLLMSKKPEINEGLVYDFLSAGLLDHTPETFFSSIYRLQAGHYIIQKVGRDLTIQPYWQLSPMPQPRTAYKDNVRNFRDLFFDSIRLQMRSDVTVGSCLSGGMDSSAVVAVASALNHYPMKVFTARYRDPSMDEWEYASSLAGKATVDSFTVFAEARDFWDCCADVVWSQEEPFGGPAIYAQWILMHAIQSNGVKVILDGQGGDELLCGYAKYFFFFLRDLCREWQVFKIASILALAPLYGGKHLLNFKAAKRYVPGSSRALAFRLLQPDFCRRHEARTISHPADNVRSQQIIDISKSSLPILLRYEDKNAMAHSIESRVPFLDHRLVEFAVSLPTQHKLNGARSKRIMRDALIDVIPEVVLKRRSKLGFGGTFVSWVNILSPKMESWLDQKVLGIDQYLRRSAVHEQLRQKDPNVFRALILERWMERFHYT